MDLQRRRILTRMRVQRHRALRSGVEKLTGNQFFPKIHEGSSSDGADEKKIEALNDLSAMIDSRNKEIEDAEEASNFIKIEISKDSQEQSTANGFELEAIASGLKSSPGSSATSETSCMRDLFDDTSYAERQLPNKVPSMAETRWPDPSMHLSRDKSSWISTTAGSNVLHQIFECMQKLANEQSKLTIAVNNMSSIIERLNGDVPTRKRKIFEKIYKLELPFTSGEDFLKFDAQLANDEKCRTALIHSLSQKYDTKKAVTKNLTAILRKFITRQIAQSYTAQKSVVGKSVFKNTTFSACLLETIDSLADDKLIAPVPDSEYFIHLGSALSNSKDWGVSRGGRDHKRQRTSP